MYQIRVFLNVVHTYLHNRGIIHIRVALYSLTKTWCDRHAEWLEPKWIVIDPCYESLATNKQLCPLYVYQRLILERFLTEIDPYVLISYVVCSRGFQCDVFTRWI